MKLLAITFLVTALPVLGLQALYFLKEGGLLPISIIDGLRLLNIGWAQDANVLIGLHGALAHVPLSPVLLSLAALCSFVGRRKKHGKAGKV